MHANDLERHLAVEQYDENRKMVVFHNVRLLKDSEREKLIAATEQLQECLEESPYARLTEEHKNFKDKIREIADGADKNSQTSAELRQVTRLLDNLLSALRGFDDRTGHNISQRYGKDSQDFIAFKADLSEQFDNNFAYRFACQLRNYSQHTGSTLTNISASADIEGNSQCNPIFDTRILLAKYSKWQSQVKKDLEQINGEISAVAVIESMMASCTKVYGKFMLRGEVELTAAADVINGLVAEALSVEKPEYVHNKRVIILGLNKSKEHQYDMSSIEISPVRIDLAENCKSVYQQIKAIVII